MDYTEKPLRKLNRYEGVIVDVQVDEVSLPDGGTSFREVIEHPGGVCILPVDENGNAVCVRQYRYACGKHLLEIPAGKLEKGEEPQACGERELSEETGYTAGRVISLGKSYSSPGISTETIYLYLALDLKPGKMHLDENEFLDVEKVPFCQLVEDIMSGKLSDGKTEIAVLKASELFRRGLSWTK